jgi:aconitase B
MTAAVRRKRHPLLNRKVRCEHGYTLIEKIIQRNTGLRSAKAGDIVTVNVDRVMVHDIFIRS